MVAVQNQEEPKETRKQKIETELMRLYKKYGDRLSSEIVLKEATPKSSPLHDEFEWNDKAAAYRHRLEQARMMIAAVKFVVFVNESDKTSKDVGRSASVRTFVNAIKGTGVKTRTQALSSEELRAGFVQNKKGELRAWCNSVIDVKELNKLRRFIEANLE